LNLCGMVAAILKMVTARIFSMSGINSGQHFQNDCHNTAQIQHYPISMTFHMCVDYDVSNLFLTLKNFWRSPFSKWPQKFNIVRYHRNLICG
jgi:hypothetical protein